MEIQKPINQRILQIIQKLKYLEKDQIQEAHPLTMELEELLQIQEEAHQVVINQLKTEIQRLSRL
jgi:hypothetical protein